MKEEALQIISQKQKWIHENYCKQLYANRFDKLQGENQEEIEILNRLITSK